MMKILVVDDELVSRVKMKKILESLGTCIEAESGRQALDEFMGSWEKGEHFDFVTLDISMPDIDGTRVLQQIREFEESKNVSQEMKVRIFMVTAQTEKDIIVSCIQAGCNDYIMKPFTREIVLKKLGVGQPGTDSAEAKGKEGSPSPAAKTPMLDYIIERFKKGETDMPPMPGIIHKFDELMKVKAEQNEIAGLLMQDPAVSARLISMSNAAFPHDPTGCDTLEQALSRLGLKAARRAIEEMSQQSSWMTSNKKYTGVMEVLWKHSLSCAYAAKLVLDKSGRVTSRDIFAMGLFHDIGKLFLLQIFAEIEKKENEAVKLSMKDLEEWLETHHCRAGSTLLTKWGFPADYAQIALLHENPDAASGSRELLVVHAANEIVKSLGFAYPAGKTGAVSDNEIIRKLLLPPEMIEEIKGLVRMRMEQIEEQYE
jgi:HD-like signal output (HDOD) protein/FixJ family two-component response regulator